MASNAHMAPAEPKAVFFREILEGDLRKFENESNDAATGGGARDLRIRPEFPYWDRMSSFFPVTVSAREKRGTILSEIAGVTITTTSLWGPTNARPDEIRISKIGDIAGWEVDRVLYDQDAADGLPWIYLLVLDAEDRVWARIQRFRTIDENREDFANFVKRAFQEREREAVRGIFDFTGGNHVSNSGKSKSDA